MFERQARNAICVAVTIILAACGGGGGVSAPSNADPQGIWLGTSSTGLSVSTLVLENKQYYAIYSSGNVVEGLVQGTLSVSGNSISDSSGVDIAPGSGAIHATLSGTVSARQSLSATVTEGGQTGTINGNYDAAYDTAPSLAQGVGTWTGSAAGTAGTTTITVASDATFTGANGPCTFSGSVKPRASGKNVLDGTVTFNDASCTAGAGATMGFEAFFSGNQLFAAGVNSARSDAFVFVGSKS
ncbi:hypothetical protein [Paraburkholderia kururiensis]|jgi:hypothetical protein|uniref:hypothetical protein n=1 Tax=Paraburkholderia kururiensis TaxID=984307 RepID=UPI00126792BE|nr:hypothetical protein [Paraburkholderia kururiensis]